MPNGPVTASGLRTLTAIEIACGAGALCKGCKDGATEFRRTSDAALRRKDLALVWHGMPPSLCAPNLPALHAVSQTARWTAAVTRRLAAGGEAFVVIGGDHSCAIGTWSGVADALRTSGPLGLIWIDAHMDMHLPETTHSGALNGMPMAALLGCGALALTSIAETGPAINSQHACLVGVRSFEPEEVAFAERWGIRVVGMEEVRLRGVDAALAEALAIATDGTAGFGISLDLDVFDPTDAPGVGTPEPGGIRAATFLEAWRELCRDPRCLGIEIVEYNPSLDRSRCTARLMENLVVGFGRRG
jgi:arginase